MHVLKALSPVLLGALLFGSPAQALDAVASFGSNPGALGMFQHIPAGVTGPMPLVLLLHGCSQAAADYAEGSGWVAFADAHGVALVAASQSALNNSTTCFNWFLDGDISAGQGEAQSLRQMVEYVQAHASIDASRIFVSGVSSGGAMAAVMLATAPDLFAAGAMMAGVPYRCAGNVFDASSCMLLGKSQSASTWGNLVRSATSHTGPWPRVSIWHGAVDTTVIPENSTHLAEQWTDVHGLDWSTSTQRIAGRDTITSWNHQGRTVVEQHLISGMGHGTAVDPGTGPTQCGETGTYLVDVDECSTLEAARFFGLLDPPVTDAGVVEDAGGTTPVDAGAQRVDAGTADAAAADAGRQVNGTCACASAGRGQMWWVGLAGALVHRVARRRKSPGHAVKRVFTSR